MIRVHEVKNHTATMNVDGILLSFILQRQNGKLKPRMFAKSGFGDIHIPRKTFQKVQRQAAAILKQELKKNSTETHPM